jgi:hypothetical protein
MALKFITQRRKGRQDFLLFAPLRALREVMLSQSRQEGYRVAKTWNKVMQRYIYG